MRRSLRLAAGIDRFTDRVGRLTAWLVVIMTVIAALNAVGRYVGRFVGANLSSNAYIELQWYLFSVIFLLGGGYTLKQAAHVRVDVLYGRFQERTRRWIDALGTALLLLPFSAFMLWVAWPSIRNSWRIREVSADPGGLPRYPIKTMLLIGFVLLLVQGVSELIKHAHALRAKDRADGVPQ